MDKSYRQYLQENLARCRAKLLEIEKQFGTESDRWHIANENILNQEYFFKHGIPRQVEQSTEIPYDLIEGF